MTKPEIRLKGFEGEWIKTPLAKIAKFSKGRGYSKMDLRPNGSPIILYGRLYTNYETVINDVDTFVETKDNSVLSKGGEIIIPASGETPEDIACASVVSRKGVILGGDLNVLSIDSSSYNKAFTALAISYGTVHKELAKYAQGKTVVHLHNSDISKVTICYPDNEIEQKSISDYFKSIDSMIQAITKKIASLKQMKSASLISMFPQKGETKPRVRFKGFEEEWVKVAIGDIFVERHEISTITKELPQLSFTIEEGVIRPEARKTNKRDFLIKDKSNKKYLVTHINDIIYNPANVIYGAIHKNSLCNGVVSPIYKIFYTEQDSSFMECIVRRPEFIQAMTVYMEGTVQKLKTLKPEAFLQMSAIIAPSVEEQRVIGRFFKSLDKQISLQEQRLEKLKQIKAACLDKMFV